MNQELIDKVKAFCLSYEPLKASDVLAVIEQTSNGEPFKTVNNLDTQREFDIASLQTKVGREYIECVFVDTFGQNIPNIRFNAYSYDVEQSSSNGAKCDVLMSFDYGLTLERPREVIRELDLLPFSSQWVSVVKTFGSSPDAQLEYIIRKMHKCLLGLSRKDTFLIVFAGQRMGLKDKVVSATPLARELARLSNKYAAAAKEEEQRNELDIVQRKGQDHSAEEEMVL